MNEKIKSEGKCKYCNKTVIQQGMSRHLATHLKENELQNPSAVLALHLLVKAGPYFLHLLVPGTKPLKAIDTFLRKIWLECCGHMSNFNMGGWGSQAVGITRKCEEVFSNTNKLMYRYDMGSTTELEIEIKGSYHLAVGDIILLSRNEPLALMCEACNKEPAESICIACSYDDVASFCKSCAAAHEKTCEDFEEYARIPVVNSPRMGVCAYEGGTIDTERDGIYQKG
jgi:hypothetical protein